MQLLPLCLALLATAGEPIKIGLVGTFSGPIGESFGIAGRKGVAFAAEEINAAGGVLGSKIEIVVRDDALNPQKAVEFAKELIEKEKVVALLGPIFSGTAEATTSVGNKARIPQIVFAASGSRVNELFAEFPENYVFRIALNEPLQATALVQQAIEARKRTSVALICDDTAYGKGGRKRIETAMELRGKKLVHVGVVSPKETDYSAQVKEARASGAQTVLLYMLAPEAVKFVKAVQASGWKPELIGTYAVLGARANPIMVGVIAPTSHIEEFPKTETARRFYAEYRKKFDLIGKEFPGAGPAVYGYDALNLLVMAIKQAGTTQSQKLKDALENLKQPYDGASGRYTKPWSPNEHEAVKRAHIIWTSIKNGKAVPLDG